MKNQVQKDYIQHNYTKIKTKDTSFQIMYPAKLFLKQENEHRTQEDLYLSRQEGGDGEWNGEKPRAG